LNCGDIDGRAPAAGIGTDGTSGFGPVSSVWKKLSRWPNGIRSDCGLVTSYALGLGPQTVAGMALVSKLNSPGVISIPNRDGELAGTIKSS
jgi:hypothetical protein